MINHSTIVSLAVLFVVELATGSIKSDQEHRYDVKEGDLYITKFTLEDALPKTIKFTLNDVLPKRTKKHRSFDGPPPPPPHSDLHAQGDHSRQNRQRSFPPRHHNRNVRPPRGPPRNHRHLPPRQIGRNRHRGEIFPPRRPSRQHRRPDGDRKRPNRPRFPVRAGAQRRPHPVRHEYIPVFQSQYDDGHDVFLKQPTRNVNDIGGRNHNDINKGHIVRFPDYQNGEVKFPDREHFKVPPVRHGNRQQHNFDGGYNGRLERHNDQQNGYQQDNGHHSGSPQDNSYGPHPDEYRHPQDDHRVILDNGLHRDAEFFPDDYQAELSDNNYRNSETSVVAFRDDAPESLLEFSDLKKLSVDPLQASASDVSGAIVYAVYEKNDTVDDDDVVTSGNYTDDNSTSVEKSTDDESKTRPKRETDGKNIHSHSYWPLPPKALRDVVISQDDDDLIVYEETVIRPKIADPPTKNN